MENHSSEVNRKSEKRRKFNWIGHTLCEETGAIEKTTFDWNPQVYRIQVYRYIEEVGRRERGEVQ